MKKILVGLFIGVALVAASIGVARIGPDVTASIFRVGDGTKALPSFSWISDTTTGFFKSTNGTSAVNVSIAGASPIRFGNTSTTGSGIDDAGRIYISPNVFLSASGGSFAISNGGGGNFTFTHAGVGYSFDKPLTISSFLFANIATVMTTNGMIGYCSDCTIANPCAGGGTGALAKRLNGVQVCN